MNRYISALALFLAAISGGALACQGSSVILDENFQKLDDYSGWNAPDQKLSYGPSGAVIKPEPGRSFFSLNSHYTSDGTDLCTTVIWPASGIKPTELAGGVGIVFWAKDRRSFYSAIITNEGGFIVSRYLDNHPVTIIEGPDGKDIHLDFVNTDAGGKNEIEVQISGVKATVFVNRRKVTEFSGQPPSAGGFVGFYATNYQDGVDTAFTYTFLNFRIAAYP